MLVAVVGSGGGGREPSWVAVGSGVGGAEGLFSPVLILFDFASGVAVVLCDGLSLSLNGAACAPPPASTPARTGRDLRRMTMLQLYEDFGLDENTQSFTGHAMALQRDDSYLHKCATTAVLLSIYPFVCVAPKLCRVLENCLCFLTLWVLIAVFISRRG